MKEKKKQRKKREGKVRQYLTGFSCFQCKLPDYDFPDVRNRGKGGKRRGGNKFLTELPKLARAQVKCLEMVE